MILDVFVVFDHKASSYLPPFYSLNTDTAIRSVKHCIADPEHTFHRNIDDFALFTVGKYDDKTGMFDLLDHPTFISNFVEMES